MNEKMAHQKIIYQLTDKRIPAASGIGIVGDILERAAFLRRFRDVKLAEKRSRKQIDAGAVMATFIALLCMGKPDFECVRELQNDSDEDIIVLYHVTVSVSSSTVKSNPIWGENVFLPASSLPTNWFLN